MYGPIPENIYQILLRSPYAGSYFRKHVKDKYPMIGAEDLEPYQPTEPIPEKNLPVIEVPNPEMNLFGQAIRSHSRKRSRNS